MHQLLSVDSSRFSSHLSTIPRRLWLGLIVCLVAWWTAWFGPAPFSEYTFFPLWLGYILAVDGLTCARTGSSLLTRNPRRFALLFVISAPLWWLFELANRFLGNWRYLMPRSYDAASFTLLASLDFSTVLPAVFVTAELLRTVAPFAPARRWMRIDLDRLRLVGVSLLGLVLFVASLAAPHVLFPFVWIGPVLFLDPINALLGNPSLTEQVRTGRWDTVLVLFAAGLVCGWFWEMWNVWSMPKWVYVVPFVGRPKLFEMPLLGYGGYLPFALEVFAVWSLLQRFLGGHGHDWLRFTRPGAPCAAAAADDRAR